MDDIYDMRRSCCVRWKTSGRRRGCLRSLLIFLGKRRGRRRAIPLSVCGSKSYALTRDLLQPAKPAETTFKKIVEELGKHFSPKPSEVVERFKSHSRNRKDGEGVAAYVAGLRKLTEHCNFGEKLPEMSRHRLVCGINGEKIQRRLLAEPDLTFIKSMDIALAIESATKHVVDI